MAANSRGNSGSLSRSIIGSREGPATPLTARTVSSNRKSIGQPAWTRRIRPIGGSGDIKLRVNASPWSGT